MLIAGLFSGVFMNSIHIRFTFMVSKWTHDAEYFWEASGRTDSQETAWCVQKKKVNITVCQQIYITSI